LTKSRRRIALSEAQNCADRSHEEYDYIRDLRPAKWGSGASLHGSNPERLMSALGQKPPRRLTATVSALPPKADTNRCGWHVRYGPKADVTHPLSWRIMSWIDLTVLRTDARAAIYDQAKTASQFDGVSQCRECGRDRAGGSRSCGPQSRPGYN
jgi:hypothetical protein